jgi:hypothetical protein
LGSATCTKEEENKRRSRNRWRRKGAEDKKWERPYREESNIEDDTNILLDDEESETNKNKEVEVSREYTACDLSMSEKA